MYYNIMHKNHKITHFTLLTNLLYYNKSQYTLFDLFICIPKEQSIGVMLSSFFFQPNLKNYTPFPLFVTRNKYKYILIYIYLNGPKTCIKHLLQIYERIKSIVHIVSSGFIVERHYLFIYMLFCVIIFTYSFYT